MADSGPLAAVRRTRSRASSRRVADTVSAKVSGSRLQLSQVLGPRIVSQDHRAPAGVLEGPHGDTKTVWRRVQQPVRPSVATSAGAPRWGRGGHGGSDGPSLSAAVQTRSVAASWNCASKRTALGRETEGTLRGQTVPPMSGTARPAGKRVSMACSRISGASRSRLAFRLCMQGSSSAVKSHFRLHFCFPVTPNVDNVCQRVNSLSPKGGVGVRLLGRARQRVPGLNSLHHL